MKSKKRTENLNTGRSCKMEKDRPRCKKMAMLGEGWCVCWIRVRVWVWRTTTSLCFSKSFYAAVGPPR